MMTCDDKCDILRHTLEYLRITVRGLVGRRREKRVPDDDGGCGWTGQLFVFRGQKCRHRSRIRSAFQKLLVATDQEAFSEALWILCQ